MENNEIQRFFTDICATPNFINSHKHIVTPDTYTDENGEKKAYFRTVDWFKNFDSDRIDEIDFEPGHDYYITKNSFVANQRKYSGLFSLDNLMFDLDFHGVGKSWSDIDFEIDKLLYLLDTDYNGIFPACNAVKSGRGVQLWVGLWSESAKRLPLYHEVADGLLDVLDRIKGENDLSFTVDRAPTKNACGVARLPATSNSKRKGFKTQFVKRTDLRYNLQELKDKYLDNASPFVAEQDEEQQDELPVRERKRNDQAARAVTSKKQSSGLGYTNLHRKRCAFIESLIHSTAENVGRRDKMLFLWYNAAVQCGDRAKAQERLVRLNKALTEPLKDGEIAAIVSYIDKKSCLLVKNSTFLSWLDLSTEEKLRYCTDTREIESRNARNKKVSRDKEIQRLWSKGLTQQEIAEQVGCSLRTVKSKTRVDKTERDRRIKDYHDKGYSIREIAILCMCSKNTVQKVITENTLPKEKASPPLTENALPTKAQPLPNKKGKEKYTKGDFALFGTVNHNTINQRGNGENDGKTQVSHYQAGCGRAGRDKTGDTPEAATQYGISGAGRTPYRES